ncbi:hypothetical protein PoB_002160100 [Plakobranchus ocellatus]|uniref:Uncharacterized protein n=1 Tax=Plakobranchus ocellatus TaxID=259542 RepID=A0AAV3ZKP0_9GAST|nr:hypothetical protein PoB_002160100 [Plakobranchus ocellatus]
MLIKVSRVTGVKHKREEVEVEVEEKEEEQISKEAKETLLKGWKQRVKSNNRPNHELPLLALIRDNHFLCGLVSDIDQVIGIPGGRTCRQVWQACLPGYLGRDATFDHYVELMLTWNFSPGLFTLPHPSGSLPSIQSLSSTYRRPSDQLIPNLTVLPVPNNYTHRWCISWCTCVCFC